jgi:hypothetical protein
MITRGNPLLATGARLTGCSVPTGPTIAAVAIGAAISAIAAESTSLSSDEAVAARATIAAVADRTGHTRPRGTGCT